MSMRDEFEKAFPVPAGIYWSEISEQYDGLPGSVGLDEIEAYQARFEGWQAAQAPASGEVEPADWGSKPSKPGYYVVKGFDSAGTEALVCVAEDDGELVCNLHDSNSDPVERYSSLLSEISNKFQWMELCAHAAPRDENRDAPIVWIAPANIRRTMIASPGETVEVSAYREGEFTAPLYTHPQPAQQGSVPEEAVSLARKWLGITESSLLHNDDITKMAEALLATSQPANQGVPEGWSLTHIDDPATDGYLVKGPGISYCAWKDKEPWLYLFCEALATTPQPEGDGWIEPDLMWDAESPEESCRDSAFEFAEDRASDMPSDETMVVNVMCAKELPSRQMKIWVDENDDLQWEWITPPTAQGGE